MPNDILNNMLDAALSQVNSMKAEAEMHQRALIQFAGVVGNLEKQLTQISTALADAKVTIERENDLTSQRLADLSAQFDRIMSLMQKPTS